MDAFQGGSERGGLWTLCTGGGDGVRGWDWMLFTNSTTKGGGVRGGCPGWGGESGAFGRYTYGNGSGHNAGGGGVRGGGAINAV